jgi:hypothetical protein
MFADFEKPTLDNYSKSIQTVCMCLVIAIVMIGVFVVSPIKNFHLVSMIGKVTCIGLLSFALYQNILISSGDDQQAKANKVYGYILSLFIFVLILSILRKFFTTSTSNPTII